MPNKNVMHAQPDFACVFEMDDLGTVGSSCPSKNSSLIIETVIPNKPTLIQLIFDNLPDQQVIIVWLSCSHPKTFLWWADLDIILLSILLGLDILYRSSNHFVAPN